MINRANIKANWKKTEQEYEDTISSEYEKMYYGHYLERYFLKHFISFLKKYTVKSDTILDIGCGTGIIEGVLVKKGYCHITGVDLSKKMISLAIENVRGCNFLAADGEHLPFEDSSFDIIICSSMLHHFPDLLFILKEMKRVLKEHGMIIIREPNQEHHFTKPSWLSGAVLTLMRYIYRIERYHPVDEPPIHEYHSSFKIKELYSEFCEYFSLLHYSTRFPFSCLFTKVKSKPIIWFIIFLEKFLKKQQGNQIYAVATNYESDLIGVNRILEKHLDQMESEAKEPKVFLAGFYFLLWIVKFYEKIKK